MSLIYWFLKSKKSMSKPNTSCVKIGKYQVSAHAQNRVADKNRNLRKKDIVINLLGKSKDSNVYYNHDNNTMQYDRINTKNRTITHITNQDIVKTIRKDHKNDENKQFKNFNKEK